MFFLPRFYEVCDVLARMPVLYHVCLAEEPMEIPTVYSPRAVFGKRKVFLALLQIPLLEGLHRILERMSRVHACLPPKRTNTIYVHNAELERKILQIFFYSFA